MAEAGVFVGLVLFVLSFLSDRYIQNIGDMGEKATQYVEQFSIAMVGGIYIINYWDLNLTQLRAVSTIFLIVSLAFGLIYVARGMMNAQRPYLNWVVGKCKKMVLSVGYLVSFLITAQGLLIIYIL